MILNNKSAWLSFSGCASLLLGLSFVDYIKLISLLFYLMGLILIVLSISVYRDEKEAISSEISIIIEKTNTKNTQPNTDAPTLLAIFSIITILFSTIIILKNYVWFGVTFYTLGWIGVAFAGSMSNNSISSVDNDRLKWTLSGSLFIILGSLVYDLIRFCPGLILTSIGTLLFSIGNVMVK